MKKRILLVDDHPIIRDGLRGIIDGNYEVCGEAVDGREAVRKATELKPDLIILDFRMPKMNGIEATREIRGLLPAAKIVLMSADYASELVEKGKLAGADAVLAKLTLGRELVGVMHQLLEAKA